jgi:hypothetical protein
MAAAMAAPVAAAPQFFPPIGDGGCSMLCDGKGNRAARPACQKGTKEGKRWGTRNCTRYTFSVLEVGAVI